jgi:hypothetical protein
MAEKILFNPGIFIDHTKFFLSIDIKIVSPIFIQKLIFCIEYFEPTGYIVKFKTDEISFSEGEFLFLGVVHYSLDVFALEFIVA